jgi:hypothetical protein
MPLTAVVGVSLGGTLGSGPFATGTISGAVSQTFAGACGGAEGKKEAKKVKGGAFTGSPLELS